MCNFCTMEGKDMELIIFKPTGETRCPKKGEWCQVCDGSILFTNYDFTGLDSEAPIFERIVVEVPANATKFTGFFTFGPVYEVKYCVDIPLKKPKVKKWIWERPWGGLDGDYKVITKEHLSDPPSDGNCWHKVEGTEIETDE